MELKNKRWSEEQFFEKRREVLAGWPTGKDVDLQEAIQYHQKSCGQKNVARKLDRAKDERRILVAAAMGEAIPEDNTAHLRALDDIGIDYAIISRDAYTRKCQFAKAQSGLEQSLKAGRSLLNGAPLVNYGVRKTREIIGATKNLGIDVGATDEEPMLLIEVAVASGATMFSSHDLHDLVQHGKNYPLDKRIQNAQYCCRLAGYYTEHGVPINIYLPGNLSGYFSPGNAIAIGMIQCLIAAEQGVKYLSPSVGLQCNLTQDVAALTLLRELANDYLHRFGYDDVKVFVHVWPWMGDWPKDLDRAAGLVAWNAAEAILGGVDLLHVKSIEEGVRITTIEGNIRSIKVARQVMGSLGTQRLAESKELATEKAMMRAEVKAIVDRVIELGDGDVARGEVKAVSTGELDVPFPSWIHAKGKVLPIRDAQGAVRYLDHGNMPLPREVIDYHRQKIAEREKRDGQKADMRLLIRDIHAQSRA
ncbi:MAG: methylaspartate mutase subunit E [Chloroflexi bacterium]|nr:methylaspartate mutase subunit E [Chloroflexota bacterium]